MNKKTPIIVGILCFILLILFIVRFNRNNFIVGEWVSPGGTIYVFKKNYKGVMKVPTHDYEFKYNIKKNKLEIDYVDDNAFDPVYEYTLEDDKLILNGVNGTFVFTKK